jgi:hypothetical protein
MTVLHPACAGSGWSSESMFYIDQQNPVEFDSQLDATDALHVVARVNLAGSNSVAYTRSLSGGTFEWPVSFSQQGAVAGPHVGAEPNGIPHVAWTGSGVGDNIYYVGANALGAWGIMEKAFTGSTMFPLQVQALNGDPFVVFAGGANTSDRGFVMRRNGAWVSGMVPIAGYVVSSRLESNGTPHLLYAALGGLTPCCPSIRWQPGD